MRLAMWSGPRNLSTAMMYAFAQRPDFDVWDEPFYGPYLRLTGLPHPMRDEILAARTETAEQIEAQLLGPLPEDHHVYHKHMCQHMIDGIPRDFMAACTNVFLLRHPARVVPSFLKEFPEAGAADIGFAQQAELWDEIEAMGQTPIAIDSHDIRRAPEASLRALCSAIGLPWDPAMLRWPSGPKPYDGPWAPVWYQSLHRSTGFAPPEEGWPDLTPRAKALVDEAMSHYETMAKRALRV